MIRFNRILTTAILGVIALAGACLFAQTSAVPASRDAEIAQLRMEVATLRSEVKHLAELVAQLSRPVPTSPPASRPASQPATIASYPPEWIPGFKTVDRWQAGSLADLAKRIKSIENDLPKLQEPARSNMQKQLSDLRQQHATLRDTANAVPPLSPLTTLAIGQIGPLDDGGTFKVIQVGMSKTDAIGEIRVLDQEGIRVNRQPRPVSAVERGFLTRAPGSTYDPPVAQPTIWKAALFVGIDASAMADGQITRLTGPFSVIGTRRLETADGGSITYFVVKRLDETAWKAAYLVWKKTPAVTTRPAEKAAKQP